MNIGKAYNRCFLILKDFFTQYFAQRHKAEGERHSRHETQI